MSVLHTAPTVDVNIPRFNQTVVALLIAAALITNTQWLVAVVALLLLAPALVGAKASLPGRLYVRYVRDLVDPGGPSQVEDARPPRFATRLGALFTVAATAAFVAGWSLAGWALAAIVGALALLAATARICVGCIIYEKVVA